MKKILFILALPVLFAYCGHKKASGGEAGDITDVNDFFALFREIHLPVQFTDTLLTHRPKDTATISFRNFTHFVPDSVITAHFGKYSRPRIYPVGKVGVKRGETYLFVRASSSTRRIFYVLSFDKSDQFRASLPLMYSDGEGSAGGIWSASMDNKYTLTTSREHKSSKGEPLYQKAVYVYNDAGAFTLILMESNEATSKNLQIINPIDTFARKHKFSGNYVLDKRNFVAIRDAKNPTHFIFFIHFEKENGDCKGELKGEAKISSPQSALFRAAGGDPCALQFNFSGTNTQVSIRETGGCGNHRDIKCYFEGTFQRQKERPKETKGKTTMKSAK
jgi:hypothetical protein